MPLPDHYHPSSNAIKMAENTFTIIDAFNQFWTACEDGDRQALSCAGLTYFYLSKVWNATGRPLSFRRQNTLIGAELCISKPTLDSHRNTMKQAGLIEFTSKGRGDPNITYWILARKPKNEVVKKAIILLLPLLLPLLHTMHINRVRVKRKSFL